MQTIDFHLLDGRGVYLQTMQIDPMGPLPGRGTLVSPPDAEDGSTRMLIGDAWQQVPDADVPPPVVPPAYVPQVVSRRQARQALLLAGLLASVQPAINAIPDPTQRQMAQIEWDDSLEFTRTRPLLIQLGYAIGLDDAGLDALFVQAAVL